MKKSVDDDVEVANTFPMDKTTPFAVPRPPRARPPLVSTLLQFIDRTFLSSIRPILLKKLFLNLKFRRKHLVQIY